MWRWVALHAVWCAGNDAARATSKLASPEDKLGARLALTQFLVASSPKGARRTADRGASGALEATDAEGAAAEAFFVVMFEVGAEVAARRKGLGARGSAEEEDSGAPRALVVLANGEEGAASFLWACPHVTAGPTPDRPQAPPPMAWTCPCAPVAPMAKTRAW